ncbi:hypothetical protein K501DRAFT_230328, partial [Backusella circina FSU 941]
MKIPGITTEHLKSIFNRKSLLYYVSNEYSVKAIPNNQSIVRASIISGKKKLGKSAVIRNRADRRVRAALQSTLPKYSTLKGYDLLFYTQPAIITSPWSEVVEKMNKALKAFEKQINSPIKK